jgi:TonB family protein
MADNRCASRLVIIAALMAGGVPAHAQSTPPPTDPAISRIAAHIAALLQKAHAKKVVVAELQGPEGQPHPIGKYLADQLSVSLQKEFPSLEVIDRSQQKANANDDGDSGDRGTTLEKTKDWARNLGANVVITGSFAKVSQGIGVSLSATFCNDPQRWLGLTNGLIPITDEIAALSPDPIPSPKNGIARAGVGGTTPPTCVSCPYPPYTSAARAAKYQGTVVLDVVVNPEGRAEQIIVVKGRAYGLEDNAIKAVKKWKFNPPVGPDGNPAAVRVQIEITFRLEISRR